MSKINNLLENTENENSSVADQAQLSNHVLAENEEVVSSPLGFIEEIKQAAENAQNQTGFVYEPTSGLYYDCKTGYYYNAVDCAAGLLF